jgi:ATP-dependent Clp protease protease subunit
LSSYELNLNNVEPEEKFPECYRLYLTREISQDISTSIVQGLYEIDEINKEIGKNIPIKLLINSPGGDLQCSQMICDVMNEIDTPVYTICYGQACSGGFMIFMNGEKGFRITSQNSQFMSHRFSMALEGSHSDFQYHNKEMERMHTRLIEHYQACTGLPEKKVKDLLLPEHDVWLTPEECKALNIVDEIIPMKRKYDGIKKRTKTA